MAVWQAVITLQLVGLVYLEAKSNGLTSMMMQFPSCPPKMWPPLVLTCSFMFGLSETNKAAVLCLFPCIHCRAVLQQLMVRVLPPEWQF